jgi:hypothetical protein
MFCRRRTQNAPSPLSTSTLRAGYSSVNCCRPEDALKANQAAPTLLRKPQEPLSLATVHQWRTAAAALHCKPRAKPAAPRRAAGAYGRFSASSLWPSVNSSPTCLLSRLVSRFFWGSHVPRGGRCTSHRPACRPPYFRQRPTHDLERTFPCGGGGGGGAPLGISCCCCCGGGGGRDCRGRAAAAATRATRRACFFRSGAWGP